MREPFVKVYGAEYFQKHWRNWVNTFGRYYTEKDGE